ncbi:hypothetical protein MXM41_22530, partial [Leclercia adecarboxylata]|uniref:hypothetical protein n=1 Tax=Leclercia adecarboxylata TaxID=83655 RepID=UPI002DBF5678
EQNRATGNAEPEQWTIKQVVNITQCRAIQRSYEASQAWKQVKGSWSDDTPAAKKERTQKEATEQKAHAERVRQICGDADAVMRLFADEDFFTFEQVLRSVSRQWEKRCVQMDRQISAYIQSGHNIPYAEAREQRLTMEAFCGATARLHAVVMTLQQIADAENIILRDGSLPEQVEAIDTVKRCAVLWARDVLDNNKVLVMGFTHPLLAVVGDPMAWGTAEDEHGKQWLCVWQNECVNWQDQLTPFDAPATEIDESGINPALLRGSSLPPVPVANYGDGWKETGADYLYEQQEKKQRREAAAAKAAAEAEARAKADAEKRAATQRAIARTIQDIRAEWESKQGDFYAYASGKWNNEYGLLDEAHQRIAEAGERVDVMICELEQMLTDERTNDDDWRYWQMTNTQKRKSMLTYPTVFESLLNPF